MHRVEHTIVVACLGIGAPGATTRKANMKRAIRNLSSIGLVLAMLAAAACSALAIREVDCASDMQCEEAFGPGATCSAAGTCVDAVDDGPAAETGGDTESSCPGELCSVELADACGGAEVPTLTSSSDPVLVTTVPLTNKFDELSCLPSSPVGNDGFFAVDTNAGTRWHFHVKATDETANPSVYVLNACDERTCQRGDALDLCGAGSDEHVSFVAPAAGRYFVGIDTRTSGGAEFELLAVSPTCGNGGTLEHSESCDDGNNTPLDGCDDKCRAELRAAAPDEVEPNDDPVSANVLLLDPETQTLTVKGTMGGRCDFDNYIVEVPANATLKATVLTAGGQECSDDAPPATLRLLESDAVTELGEGQARGSNGCPSIDESDGFATALSAGHYVVARVHFRRPACV